MRQPSKTVRGPISKKLRFEVFKRDAFKCQYCGSGAPDVLLEIDHVTPVVGGGKSDILNLLTACKPCNAGKGKRPLDDNSVLTKQREQLEDLNERRSQLEMMIQWKDGLSSLKETMVDRLSQHWSELAVGFSLTDSGRRTLKKIANKFSFDEIYDALSTAAVFNYIQKVPIK